MCAYVFTAADLDGDGRDELAIDVSSAAATGLVEFYRVDLDGIQPLVIAEPGDPPYVEPGPAILGWIIYTLIRGSISGLYPYPFLNPANGGYASVAAYYLAILVLMIVVCAVVVWLGTRSAGFKNVDL